MRINLVARIGVLSTLAVIAVLGVTGAASSSPVQTGSPGVSIIAQNGFGDRNNSYAWSMDWFKGKLYVGTGRDELCIENEIVQFYYPHSNYYTSNPSPNVRCTPNAFNLPLQAQIWQYTPPATTTTTTTKGKTSSTTVSTAGKWQMVYRSPLISNPADKGHTVARDLAYRGMVTMSNSHGQTALFADADTPDEYIPALQKSHPPVLMRSFDGVHWQTMHMPAVEVHFPTGNFRPMGYRSLLVWHNHLFVTALPDFTGDGGLFEVINPFSSHPGLRQVSDRNLDIFEIQKFDGGLYIGTGSKTTGYGVYRTFTYRSHGLFDFHPVVTDGAGRGYEVTSVVSMYVYRNRLYVGSSGWYNQGTIPASEMIRIAPDGQWTLVVGNPRNLPDGQTINPVSGLYDGFFSPFAAHFWRMAQQGGGLYVGTNDWAYLVQETKQYAWLQETVLAGVLGFNIWATCDGNDWFAVTRDAFTGDEYNFGGRNLVTDGPNGQDLYIGSANQAQGTSIFDDQGEACESLVNGKRQAAARPGALMTESLRHGTLLSWAPTPKATGYEVMRAPFINVTLGLKAPVTLPNGWQFEDAAPTVTPVGAPGSVTETLSMAGGFEPVGTSVGSDFVDPKQGHYVYEVVAKTATGATSAPSNVEVTPFGGAPATFTAMQSALRTSVAATPARSGRISEAVRAQSGLQRLLSAAEMASADGRDAAAERDVARVQALAGDNDTLAAVAARVERRLQYASVAGAP